MDLQPHSVAESVTEELAKPGGGDGAPGCAIDFEEIDAFGRQFERRLLRLFDGFVNLRLPTFRLPGHYDSSGHVGVIAIASRTCIDDDEIPGRQLPRRRLVVGNSGMLTRSDNRLERAVLRAQLAE